METQIYSFPINKFELTLDRTISYLKENDPIHCPDAIRFALNHQEEITPRLLNILRNFLLNPKTAVETWSKDYNLWIVLYAVMLLGVFREKDAHALFLDLLHLPEEDLDTIFGVFVGMEFPYLLFLTYPGSAEGLKNLIAAKSTATLARSAAIEALTYLVAEQKLQRMEVLHFFGNLFQGNEAPKYSEFWTLIAKGILDLYPAEKYEIIKDAYHQGLIFKSLLRPNEFKKMLRESCLEDCILILKTHLKSMNQTLLQRIFFISILQLESLNPED